jgi:SAM-dependent methyltransferase
MIFSNPPAFPSSHFDNLSEIETSYWWHLSRLNWVEWIINKWIPETAAMEMVDFGCGTGGFLHTLCKRVSFKSSLGIDISSKAIHQALKYGPNYQHVPPGDYSLVKGKSLIFLMDTLEHIQNDQNCLSDLMDSMVAGGHLLISVPAMPSLSSAWDDALGHFRRYSKGSLRNLVNNNGGEILEVRYIFSYIVPAILVRRKWMNQEFNETNCEFPATSPLLNRFLLWCNRKEIYFANRLYPPVGSSLLCLAKKRG